MKTTASLIKKAFNKSQTLRAMFSNQNKPEPQPIVGNNPNSVVEDAVRAQNNLIEGYDTGMNTFISK
mgnify:CR=1 FL=1